jgi:hypothetical protein
VLAELDRERRVIPGGDLDAGRLEPGGVERGFGVVADMAGRPQPATAGEDQAAHDDGGDGDAAGPDAVMSARWKAQRASPAITVA